MQSVGCLGLLAWVEESQRQRQGTFDEARPSVSPKHAPTPALPPFASGNVLESLPETFRQTTMPAPVTAHHRRRQKGACFSSFSPAIHQSKEPPLPTPPPEHPSPSPNTLPIPSR